MKAEKVGIKVQVYSTFHTPSLLFLSPSHASPFPHCCPGTTSHLYIHVYVHEAFIKLFQVKIPALTTEVKIHKHMGVEKQLLQLALCSNRTPFIFYFFFCLPVSFWPAFL